MNVTGDDKSTHPVIQLQGLRLFEKQQGVSIEDRRWPMNDQSKNRGPGIGKIVIV